MNDIKWYFIAMTTMIGLIIGGQAISDWRTMDCRLTLGQSGRTPADIREICK
jgi:hypothetical protein